mgnify:CR=1 FL=1
MSDEEKKGRNPARRRLSSVLSGLKQLPKYSDI